MPRVIDYDAKSPLWIFCVIFAGTIYLLFVADTDLTADTALTVMTLITILSVSWIHVVVLVMVRATRSVNVLWLDSLRSITSDEIDWLMDNNISCTIHRRGMSAYLDFDPRKRDQEEGLVLFTLAFGPAPKDKWVGLKTLNREWCEN